MSRDNIFRLILIVTGAVVLTACGSTSKGVPEGYLAMADLSELELVESQAPAHVYVRPGAPRMGAYDRFIIDPIRVDYRDPAMEELEPEHVAELQQRFRDAVIDELHDGGYQVCTRSAPGTMRITFTISGLKAHDLGGAANVGAMAAAAVVKLPWVFAISVGEVTIEGEFRDAATNRLDAVAIDTLAGSRVLNTSPWSTWADVEATFDVWAKGIREEIDSATSE